MKKCSACGEDKPLTEFARSSQSRDGYRWKCRACVRKTYQRNHHIGVWGGPTGTVRGAGLDVLRRTDDEVYG